MGSEEIFKELAKRFNDPEYCDCVVVSDDGHKFHCSRFAMRCGSEVFHRMFSGDMRDSEPGTVHIRDAEANSIKQMLQFLHGGTCSVNSHNFLQLSILAQRYEVPRLKSLCEDFGTESFSVDTSNCCMLLKQTYHLVDVPRSLREQCEDMIRQSAGCIAYDHVFKAQFLGLSFLALKGVLKNALPRMFVERNFPSPYIKLGEAVLMWLDYHFSLEQRWEEYALDLMSLIDFSVLGLKGISSLISPDSAVTQKDNWVFALPAVGLQAVSAMKVARHQPVHITTSKIWSPPCSGRYTIVCRSQVPDGNVGDSGGYGSRENCAKSDHYHTSVATFDLSSKDSLAIYISKGISGVYYVCPCARRAVHALIVEYNLDANGCCRYHLRPKKSKPAPPGCRCKFRRTGSDAVIRSLISKVCAEDPGFGWINPKCVESYQVPYLCKTASVSIYLRSEESDGSLLDLKRAATVPALESEQKSRCLKNVS